MGQAGILSGISGGFRLPRPFPAFFPGRVSSRMSGIVDHHRKPVLEPVMGMPVREPGFPPDDQRIIAVVMQTGMKTTATFR
jgi:hypothetical protein